MTTTIHYYGTSGPRVQLRRPNGTNWKNMTLSAARREAQNPWTKVQIVRDDIHYVTQKRVLGFRFEQTYSFEPVADNDELEQLLDIANWPHRIEWFPASDQPLVHFEADVIQATDSLFTPAGYTGFVLQVRSTNLLPRIPSVDALGAVYSGPAIRDSTGTNIGIIIGQ